MENFSDTLLLVTIPFLLGYFFGKLQNQIDNLLSNEIFKLEENSEAEEESFFPTEEKLKRVEQWEKEIYDIESSYEEKQSFSHPSQKYVCLKKFCGNATVLIAHNSTDEISKAERKIKDFFEEEIVNLSVETAREYLAEYGYRLNVHQKPILLQDNPKWDDGPYLKNKTVVVFVGEKKNDATIEKRKNEITENKKKDYVKSIGNIFYEVC